MNAKTGDSNTAAPCGPWPPRLTADELLALAHDHRAIGVRSRTWSFAQGDDEGTGVLLPLSSPRYLYRGQTQRHVPCFPKLFRHLKTPARFLWDVAKPDATAILAAIARTYWFYDEMAAHPVCQWAKRQRLQLPLAELAQHYGIATPLLDLSESIEVALFFATHRLVDGQFLPCASGSGVLYIVDRDATPAAYAPRFTPVAIQPFARPFRQWAWACELLMGECFEANPGLAAVTFDHSLDLAARVRALAEADGSLFPPDMLADVAATINASQRLPSACVEAAARHLVDAFPTDRLGAVTDALREGGYVIADTVPALLTPLLTTEVESACAMAADAWKAAAAKHWRQMVVRRNEASGDSAA